MLLSFVLFGRSADEFVVFFNGVFGSCVHVSLTKCPYLTNALVHRRMEGHHSSSPAPKKSQDVEKRSEKHSTGKGDKITKNKKTKSTSRMHSFDRDFKDGKHYKNPDVTRKTPSYMRQTCASLTKVKTMRNNGTSPGPERKDKSSLNPLAEDDEDDSQFQTGSEEDFSDEDQFSTSITQLRLLSTSSQVKAATTSTKIMRKMKLRDLWRCA